MIKKRKSKNVTEKDIQAYVKRQGAGCIRCKSHDIEGGHVDIEEGGAYQNITCNACGLWWTDQYKLVDAIYVGEVE